MPCVFTSPPRKSVKDRLGKKLPNKGSGGDSLNGRGQSPSSRGNTSRHKDRESSRSRASAKERLGLSENRSQTRLVVPGGASLLTPMPGYLQNWTAEMDSRKEEAAKQTRSES